MAKDINNNIPLGAPFHATNEKGMAAHADEVFLDGYNENTASGTVSNTDNVEGAIKKLDTNLSSHTHGLLHNNFTTTIPGGTTSGGWEVISPNYNGFLLKSIRTETNAPNWFLPNFSSGICFGGKDTKGVISVAYSTPSVRFAGGNGNAPGWYMTITGKSTSSYDLEDILNKSNNANNFTSRETKVTNVTGSTVDFANAGKIIVMTVNANSTLNASSDAKVGYEYQIFIHNTSDKEITFNLQGNNNWLILSDTVLSIEAGKWAEANMIQGDNGQIYLRGQDNNISQLDDYEARLKACEDALAGANEAADRLLNSSL